jgi:hypothetical protein
LSRDAALAMARRTIGVRAHGLPGSEPVQPHGDPTL